MSYGMNLRDPLVAPLHQVNPPHTSGSFETKPGVLRAASRRSGRENSDSAPKADWTERMKSLERYAILATAQLSGAIIVGQLVKCSPASPALATVDIFAGRAEREANRVQTHRKRSPIFCRKIFTYHNFVAWKILKMTT